MFKKILLAVAFLLLVFVIVVALQPADFRVVRSIEIDAPPEVVFTQVNDFHNWDAWSPWAKLDPEAKNTFEGPAAGTGAVLAWSGNDKVGEGRMTILESEPNERIRIKLDFVRPMEDTATVEFTFRSQAGRTQVTWAMFGENSFVEKTFCLFMNLDKMVGGDFERGLAQLKEVAEAAARK